MIGRLISHYRILGRLGSGGMGDVFLAEDEALRRGVALKSLRAEFRLDRERRGRFLREARVLSHLDHPHICRIFDYVTEPDADYLVLEHIEGRDLRRWISAGIDPRRAMELAQQVTDALVAAHAAGIVHRDLKPANVMVTPEGDAKVLDFGLSHMRGSGGQEGAGASADELSALAAATVGDHGSLIWNLLGAATTQDPSTLPLDESLQTLPGGLVGTLRYMSPEQARGEDATAASDMYALGLLLQELFTGKPAFEAELTPPQALERGRKGQSRPVEGLDRDLSELIESLKSPTPSRRPTALEALRRLRWIQSKPQRRLRRAAGVAVLLLAVAGGVKYTLDLARERAHAEGRTEAALRMMETLFSELVPVLNGVGRLDAFDAAADAVQAYFTRIGHEDLTDLELVQMAKLFNLIGDVRQLQGQTDDAREALRTSLVLSEQLEKRRPEDPDVLLTLGAAHFYLGQLALQIEGNPRAALESFRAYLDLAERNARVDSDRVRADTELAYARGAIAGALIGDGRPEEALPELEQLVKMSREHLMEQPGNEAVLLDLADNLSWLGSAQQQARLTDAAWKTFEEERGLRDQLLLPDPRNAEARSRLAFCLIFLARLHLASERPEPALEAAEMARDILTELIRLDATNADLPTRLKAAQELVAQAHRSIEGSRLPEPPDRGTEPGPVEDG